jgi:hypothetical protein
LVVSRSFFCFLEKWSEIINNVRPVLAPLGRERDEALAALGLHDGPGSMARWANHTGSSHVRAVANGLLSAGSDRRMPMFVTMR